MYSSAGINAAAVAVAAARHPVRRIQIFSIFYLRIISSDVKRETASFFLKILQNAFGVARFLF